MTARSQTIKSILILAGSFALAFLLGEMVHEFGHYFCHLAYGNDEALVHLDPFGGSRIVGVVGLSDKVMGVTSAAGPLFNLACGISAFALLWRKRQPILLPLLMWGPVAMIQEGVTFSLGLMTPGGDAQWVVRAGMDEFIVLLGGLGLLSAGVGAVAWLIPVAGVEERDSFWKRFGIVVVGMCSLMLVRAGHSLMVSPTASLENLIPLVLSCLLAAAVVGLQRPVAGMANKAESPALRRVTWATSAVALALGASMFVLQSAA